MIKKFLEDKFVKHNIILFASSMVASFFSYLFHPVLSRMMSLEEYGEVQSLISLYLQITIFLTFFSTIVINIVANHEKQEDKIMIISQLRKLAMYVVIICFFAIVVASSFLQSILKFESFVPFIILAVILILCVSSAFRRSYMQGVHNFKALSASNVIFNVGRLIFSAILVFLGFKTLGAFVGLLLAKIVLVLYVYQKTKKEFQYIKEFKIKITPRLKKELKYGVLVFITSITITFLYTMDVLVVKYFFSPQEAGLYSGVSTVARIIFFLTGTITAVLLPYIKFDNHFIENQKLFFKALILTIILGGSAFAFFCIFPNFSIKILIGKAYTEGASMLPLMGILFMLVSFIQLIYSYYLALRKYFLIYISLAGVAFIIVLTYFSHNTMVAIINNFIYGSCIIMLLFLARYIYNNLRPRNIYENNQANIRAENYSKKSN